MAMRYVQVYFDFIHSLTPLSDAERGRLFTAMLEYAGQGTEPDLRGNERFVWPQLKSQIDRDNERYDEISQVRSEAGKLGGRPKANALSKKQKNQMQVNDNKCHQEEDKDNNKDEDEEEKRSRKARFSPPSIDDVKDYCTVKGYALDAQTFVDFYESKGWRVGNQPMRDWKAAVRTWAKREQQSISKSKGKTVIEQQYNQRDYSQGRFSELTPEEIAEAMQYDA